MNEDLQTIKKARPYIRSIASFILFLRFGAVASHSDGSIKEQIRGCYTMADEFAAQLEEDVAKDGQS